jgi:hypothetical protein
MGMLAMAQTGASTDSVGKRAAEYPPRPAASTTDATSVAEVDLPKATIDRASIIHSYGQLPIRFEANHGQTDEQIRFISRGKGYTLFLTRTDAVLSLAKGASNRDTRLEQHVDTYGMNSFTRSIMKERTRVLEHTSLRLKFADANPAPRIEGLEELPTKSNYLIGDKGADRTNIPNYARVRYEGLYPGVDLIFHGGQSRLEYDLVVSPGADPSAIRLAFEGADRLEIDEQGDLVIHVEGERVRQYKPLIYQEVHGTRVQIEGGYVLRDDQRVTFEIASYDRNEPLIIDPVIVYATYVGGSDADWGSGIAVDAAGNAYITGSTLSRPFPGASDPMDATQSTYVLKLNAAGSNLVYSTFLLAGLPTARQDDGEGIAVDVAGNAYVTGFWFPHAFVVKLDPTGSSFLYPVAGVDVANGPGLPVVPPVISPAGVVILGTPGGHITNRFTRANAIAIDASGNAYVTGQTTDPDFLTFSGLPPNPIQPGGYAGGVNDAFVTKIDPSGSIVYSTFLGGTSGEFGTGIAVDGFENAYVTGRTISSDYPTTGGAFQELYNGGSSDVFVTKLDAAGSAIVYSTFLGGDGEDAGADLAVNSAGNAYVTGSAGVEVSFPFPTTAGAFQTSRGGAVDAFASKLNVAGSGLIYSTFLGGSNLDKAFGIAVDPVGSAYVSGFSTSPDFPELDSPFPATSVGQGFVTKFQPDGSAPDYSAIVGNNPAGLPRGDLALDSSFEAYLTGITDGISTTAGAFQTTYGGGASDAFILKLGTAPSPGDTTPPICNSSPSDQGGTLGVDGTAVDGVGIVSVTLTQDSNVTLTCNPPSCTASAPGLSYVSFRATQANTALDAHAKIVVADAAGNFCDVPVQFTGVGAGAILDKTVHNESGVIVKISNPDSALPAGTFACSSHLYNSSDPALPCGFENSPPGDPFPGRVVTCIGPINVVTLTEMTYIKDGPFNPNLRLLFSSFDTTSNGFPPFIDITETVEPLFVFPADPTKKGGKRKWSTVKMHCAAISETFNNADDDGDGFNDEGLCSVDQDLDTFSSIPASEDPADADCDDGNPNIYPGAVERCNGMDDDCDGMIDENFGGGGECTVTALPLQGACATGLEVCVDGSPEMLVCGQTVFPSPEVCNGIDDDCNGLVDDSCDVLYVFTGFLPPVENDALNIVKAGSVVPLKWQLQGETGAFISALDVVTGTSFQAAPCESLAGEEMMAMDDAETSGGAGLHYDDIDNQFVFNWKTRKNLANTCAMFLLDLADGSQHSAEFRFKRK